MIKHSSVFSSVTVILALVCVHDGKAFNLSPKPNIVLREPKTLGTGIPKMRSSYFGFSLNLKQNSVLIGTPRAQSTLRTQRKINETGAIYKCTFDKSPAGNCSPFIFDELGSHSEPNDEYTLNNEKKDYQWLGASMDGSDSENDKFVVCAPRIMSDQSRVWPWHYLLHGICYWTTNTSSSEPMNVQKIAPLRLKSSQQLKVSKKPYYIYGEQGLSVHITENMEEILIGAPGIFGWCGSVIRHKAKLLVEDYNLSRRKRQQTEMDPIEYSSDVPNPKLWNQEFDSYFGFAVSSGYFDGSFNGIENSQLLYVASAPKANMAFGAVYIFDIVDSPSTDKTIKIYHIFAGQQMGEYFGYSLLTEDFNNDGFPDIAIGAPYNSKAGTHENGAVYIYKNEGSSSNFALHAVLRTDFEFDGRFGTTISKVGDINQDGIRNNGPSNLKSIYILVSLPISLLNPWTLERENLIDTSSLTIKSIYNGQYFDVEWMQNNTILDLHAEDPFLPVQTLSTTNEINFPKALIGGRSRRSLENIQDSHFNPYSQKVVETRQSRSSIATDLIDKSFDPDLFSVNDRILSNLPSNRTIHFDCKDSNQEYCLVGRFRVSNFKASNSPVLITLNFAIDMAKMARIMSGKRDILVIRTSVELGEIFDDDTSTVQVVQNQPFTVISKYVDNSTPLWIYVLSIIFGLLSLILISYALFRFGFFTRGKRDELVKLKRQSELISYWVVPGDGMDDD
ncbi:integrin alpha-PS3-like [Sitodiplosis mosellana]|uniref:integrin alpha-PS3-like n=1 Tax=Sitodiplosis mosellana TaxID=263140 RepID=UPI00244388EA|nr:integrin alpha-PS3-like [Sitodiplosis mosellana]